MIDLHSHLMPGVDDGAATLEEAQAGLAALSRQGVEVVAATPHLSASVTLQPERLASRLAEFDAAWRVLAAIAEEMTGAPRVLRAAELMLDDPRPNLSDPRTRIDGGTFVLVEFAGTLLPPRSAPVLRSLAMSGAVPVLAHPERYALRESVQITEWRAAGAVMQINAGSLLGKYGREVEQIARRFLAEGWADCIASDYHSRGEPTLFACAEMLRAQGAEEQQSLLMIENPARIIAGKPPLFVPPLSPPKRSRWFG